MKNAKVIAVHRERYELLCDENKIYGRLKTSAFYNKDTVVSFPTIGDMVEIEENTMGDSLILSVLPRKTAFVRLNPSSGQPDLAVAANFDYVLIVSSLNGDFNLSKLERYLTVAHESGGTPVVVLTKLDLCDNPYEYVEKVCRIAPDVKVYCVSSYTGEGFEEMEEYFGIGKTCVLLGSSGVGKSSFVNSILGKEEMETGAIREADAQGRHTTTYKMSFDIPKVITLKNGKTMPGGGCIMDTPGIRKLVVSDVEQGIERYYEDIEELAGQCKFSNCSHTTEPGCAIRRALENETLSPLHWKNYCQMIREDNFAKERQKALEMKFKKQNNKKKR